MIKYLLVYTGDSSSMPKTEEEGKAMIKAWMDWYADIGENLLDGGFPFQPGAKMTDGKSVLDSTAKLAGYLLIQAKDYDAAMSIAKKGPLPEGGMIHVMEGQDMPSM